MMMTCAGFIASRHCATATATAAATPSDPSAPAASATSTVPPSPDHRPGKLHVYRTFATKDGFRKGLSEHMSDIQREEFQQREAVELNMGQTVADPIWQYQHLGQIVGKTKGSVDHFIAKDTQRHWMRVVDAARILGIPKDKIAGLTAASIEEKFATAYGGSSSNGEKDAYVSAAEVLLEYAKSPFAADVSRARKIQALHKMKSELDDESRAWHNKIFEALIYGASGWITGAITLTAVAIIGFAFYSRSDHLWSSENNLTAENMQKFVRMTVNWDPNLEGTPDYANRYVNTPTSLDLMHAAGHAAIADPNIRGALQQQDAIDRKELALMAVMLRDADAIGKQAQAVVEREDARRTEDPVGPRLLKEMMESRVDAEWWKKAQQLQAIYREGSFVTKW